MSYKRNQTRYSKKHKKFSKKNFIRFYRKYRNNPINFIENFYDAKLYPYQKIYLKYLDKTYNIKNKLLMKRYWMSINVVFYSNN